MTRIGTLARSLLAISAALSGCHADFSNDQAIARHQKLRIYSTTDLKLFSPLIDDFHQLHPDIEIDYVTFETSELDRRYRRDLAQGRTSADLLLSSAMDQQIKLVNDGYATPHRSENAAQLPQWARWRDEALGFTFEPAVMVVNLDVMKGRPIPQSRQDLLQAIRADHAFWTGRIGTYDIQKSSIGYLVASQDARHSSEFGALAEAFREADVVTEGGNEVLDRVASGELALGYNLLGSNARARAARASNLRIVYPADYTLAIARTAVIPRSAANLRAAHIFLDYLLSERGQRTLTLKSGLNAVRPDVERRYGSLNPRNPAMGPVRAIALGPGLLVYLDQQKRQQLLALWTADKAQMPPRTDR